MLRQLFLGRPWQWGLWIVVIAVLAAAGEARLHVREFNWFAVLVTALGVLCVALLVFRHRPGDRVTREPLEDDADAT